MIRRIGFMQGRLSDLIDGKIQAFPVSSWQTEFAKAEAIGLSLMEWTIDQNGLYLNPLMTDTGRKEIAKLCYRHKLQIESVTGDCFMQAPFWKTSPDKSLDLKRDFLAVCESCADLGISTIVLPLVDNGRIETSSQENILIEYLISNLDLLRRKSLRIAFEIDFEPKEVLRFITRLPSCTFGINYDIGNSAALGFDATEELSLYGDRVINVHIKDRILGGGTVPLLTGAADFEIVFKMFKTLNYSGNFILQTARADNNEHDEVLRQYLEHTKNWVSYIG